MRLLMAFMLGVVLVATLTGCGGNRKSAQPTATTTPQKQAAPHKEVNLDKAAYIKTMRPLGKRLTISIERIYPIVETTPGSTISNETAAVIEKTRVVVAAVLASAASIVPPKPIRADHRRLVQGLSDLQAELGALIHFLHKGGPNPFGLYASLPGLQTIAAARISIEKEGYAIG
jgi:hypothetical protein